MDYTRYCYSTVIKPFRDADTLVPIRWYRPQFGAVLKTGWSRFRSCVTWNRQDPLPDVGEQQKSRQTTYHTGSHNLDLFGDHTCGSADVWENGARVGVDPTFTTDSTGLAPCCLNQAVVNCCTHGHVDVPAGSLHLTLGTSTFFPGVTSMTLPHRPDLEGGSLKRVWQGDYVDSGGKTGVAHVWIVHESSDDSCHLFFQIISDFVFFPIVDDRDLRRIIDLDCDAGVDAIVPYTGENTSAPYTPVFGASYGTRSVGFPVPVVTHEWIAWLITQE